MLTPQRDLTVPCWTVTLEELADLHAAARPRLIRFPYPTFPLIFSCSPNGIWPTTSLGYTQPGDRHYVDGRSNILDTVAHLMMSRADSATGGRFTVTLDGATRTRDAAPIAHFELTA